MVWPWDLDVHGLLLLQHDHLRGIDRRQLVHRSRPRTAGPVHGHGADRRSGQQDSDEDDPTLTPALLELVFVSDRLGDEDLFIARRDSVMDTFDTVEALTVLKEFSRENTPRFSLDGTELYFASERARRWSRYTLR